MPTADKNWSLHNIGLEQNLIYKVFEKPNKKSAVFVF
jgi:hypothetical protein